MTILSLLYFLLAIYQLNAQLYSLNDNVTVFNRKSFETAFNSGADNNWIVQFYHSYCGHCIDFAPIFKKFLLEAQHWNWIVNIGVVDCASERSLCHTQKVNSYPTLVMYLAKESQTSNKIITLPSFTGEQIYDTMIDVVMKNINAEELSMCRTYTNLAESSYIYMIGNDLLSLRRAVLTFNKRTIYPLFYQFSKTSDGFRLRISINGSVTNEKAKDLPELYKILSNYVGTRLSELPGRYVRKPKVKSKVTSHPVYNQDIYSSIWFVFTNEIMNETILEMNNLRILSNFVQLLYRYSGLDDVITNSLKTVNDLLKDNEELLLANKPVIKSWSEILYESKLPNVSPSWIGCNGSKPHLRRYPCGLWTTFHALTVGHHEKVLRNESSDISVDLIFSIRQFIFTFFSCRFCADNFKKETTTYNIRVTNSEDLVLYLWMVHNSVNKRLSGQPSDDPMHSKISFPSLLLCPDCRQNQDEVWPVESMWKKDSVFEFLMNHYSIANRVPFHPQSYIVTSNTLRLVSLSVSDMSLYLTVSILCSIIVMALFMKYFVSTLLCKTRKSRKYFGDV